MTTNNIELADDKNVFGVWRRSKCRNDKSDVSWQLWNIYNLSVSCKFLLAAALRLF